MAFSKEEFGGIIKKKYPQYKNIDNLELADQVLKKYPQYQGSIDENLQGSSIQEPTKNVTEPQQKGFFSRLGTDIKKRASSIADTFRQTKNAKINPIETGVQTVGQAAGLATDVIGEGIVSLFRGLSNITPDVIKDPAKKQFTELLRSPEGQKAMDSIKGGIDSYNKFKTENPNVAKDIESVVNIGAILPLGVEKGIVTKAGQKIENVGKAGIESQKLDFAKDLVTPAQTKKVKEAQVKRTTESGFGPFKKSTITPSTSELKSAEAIAKLPGVSSKNTIQGNYNVIANENTNIAKQLSNDLKSNDFIFTTKELKSRLDSLKNQLAEDPELVGDSSKSAQKVLNKFDKILSSKPNKGSELLAARKELDTFLKKSTGGKIFDSAGKETAISKASKMIRSEINNFIDEKAANVQVKSSLAEQRSLFNALDNIRTKAAKEADTAFKRTLQRAADILGTKNRVVQGVAAAVGIGGLGAAATFAPAAAATIGSLFVLGKTGKLLFNPKLKIQLGKLLKEIDKIPPTTITKATAEELRKEIEKLLGGE